MDENKLDVIRSYLSGEFASPIIEEKYDFDRSAQTFKIRVGRDLFLLKAGDEFLGDNNEEQIRKYLEDWQVANLLIENSKLGIFVGNSAPNCP